MLFMFSRSLTGAILALAIGLVTLSGCAAEKASPPRPPGTPPVTVSHVAVSVAPSLSADRVQAFNGVDGSSRLTRALESALTKAGTLDPSSPRVLDVQVTKYRMRSGATVFWFGLMAGGDLLDVTATVSEGGQAVRTVSTGAGTSGAFAGLDQVSRFEKVSGAVAERVVKQL